MLRMLLLIVAQVLLSLGGLYKIKTSSEIVSTEFMIGFACYGISFCYGYILSECMLCRLLFL